MNGRSTSQEETENSPMPPEPPNKLSKQNQKELFPGYNKAPPNSKQRNQRDFRIGHNTSPNPGISKFDRLIKKVEQTHSGELNNEDIPDRDLTPDLLIQNKLMSHKDSQKSTSVHQPGLHKDFSQDSIGPHQQMAKRKILKKGKMSDSQVIQNTLISNPEHARLAGRRSQNFSNFRQHSGALVRTMEVNDDENYNIVHEAVEFLRNSKAYDRNKSNVSKISQDHQKNYISGYDSKGRFLPSYNSKSSRGANGLREDTLGGMARNDMQYQNYNQQRLDERPAWQGVISDDEPEPMYHKQRFHGTNPNIRFNQRGEDYESPHFDYTSPISLSKKKGKTLNHKLREEARQMYGRTPKGLDPDSRVLRAMAPPRGAPQYPLTGMNRKQKRIASSSPIDPHIRNRVEKMKKKWIPAVVKKQKPMGYGQIDKKQDNLKKKNTSTMRKKKNMKEPSYKKNKKNKKKNLYGTYDGHTQFSPHGYTSRFSNSDRQSSGNSWLRGQSNNLKGPNKNKKATPNYHSDSQKPFAKRGTPRPYGKKAGNPYSRKTKESKNKNPRNPYSNYYNPSHKNKTKKAIPRVALLHAKKVKKDEKKSYRNLYEQNQYKGPLVHSKSGPKPSKFKHPKTTPKSSKSAGSSRLKKIGFAGKKDPKKKKKRFRYKLSSQKTKEKRRVEERKREQTRLRHETEHIHLEAQKNVMKMGQKMLHERQNKNQDKEKLKKKKMMKFRANKAIDMDQYGYGMGYGTVPIRNLAQIPENERVRSIPAKQPRRGIYNQRNTGSLQPKIKRNSKTKNKNGRVPYGKRVTQRESHKSRKSNHQSNPRNSNMRSSNMRQSKPRSSKTRNSNARSSNIRSSNFKSSTKRSITNRSSKIRTQNLKSNKNRGTSEFYTSKGYDTHESDQYSVISYPVYKPPQSKANLYKPKNRIKRKKQVSEYASGKSKELIKEPRRSQTKPEIRKPASKQSKFISFGKRKASRKSKEDSILFKNQQKDIERTLMEVEGQIQGITNIRKSILREKTQRSLSRKMKKFLRSANLREPSPLATHRNLRFNKTEQNITESEIRDSLIEGLKDDSRVYDNDTSVFKDETQLVPPLEAPADLESSETDHADHKHVIMMSSVNISQTFQPNQPLLLSQVQDNLENGSSDSEIRENKDLPTMKNSEVQNSLVQNFKTKGRNKVDAEHLAPMQDKISEIIQSDDKSNQMMCSSQVTVKKKVTSFKKNKMAIIESEDLQSEYQEEEMKLANLKLKPGEAAEDLKQLLNVDIPGFSNRKLNLTGEISLTNPKIRSLGMTGSTSLKLKNDFTNNMREPFMKNKDRSPRRLASIQIIQSEKRKKAFPKIKSEAVLIQQTDFQPKAHNKNQKDFLDFKKRMKKRPLVKIPRSPRSSQMRSISRDKKLSPIGQTRFNEQPKKPFFKNKDRLALLKDPQARVNRERTRSFSKDKPRNLENPFEMKPSGTLRKLKKIEILDNHSAQKKKLTKKSKDRSSPKRKNKSPKNKKSRSPRRNLPKKSKRSLNDEFNLNVSDSGTVKTSNESESERIKKLLGKREQQGTAKSKRTSKFKDAQNGSKPASTNNESMISKDKLPDSIGQIKELLVKGKIKKNEHQDQYIRKKLDLDKLKKARLKRKKSQVALKRDASKDNEIIAGIRKDLSNKKLRPFGSLDSNPSSNKLSNSPISDYPTHTLFQNPTKFERISKNRSLEDLEVQQPYFNKRMRSKSPLRVIANDHSEKKLKPLSKSPNKSLKLEIKYKNQFLTKQTEMLSNHFNMTRQSHNSQFGHTIESTNRQSSPNHKTPKKFQQSLKTHPLHPNRKEQTKKLKMFKSLVAKNSPKSFINKKLKVKKKSVNTKPILLDLTEIEERIQKMQRPESRKKFNQSRRMRITSYLQKSGSFKLKKSLKRIKPKTQRIKRKNMVKEKTLDNASVTSSISGLNFDQSMDRNFTMQKCPSCLMYFPLAKLHFHIQNCS